MQISFLHNPPPPLSLQISDAELEVVSSVKLLGVTIQNNLKWDQQVQKLITNGSRRLYILSRLRKNGVKPNDLILIYKLYILPILEFGAVVWSSGLSIQMSCLIVTFLVHLIFCHSQKDVISLSLNLPLTCSPLKDTVTCYHQIDNLHVIIILETQTILRCLKCIPKDTNNPLFPPWLGWSTVSN